MTSEQIDKFMDEQEDEALKFDRVENKRHARPDIHAMLLMDEVYPGTRDMVSAAEHDQIWFNIEGESDPETYETHWKFSEAQLVELLRCGIYFDSDTESFYSFV